MLPGSTHTCVATNTSIIGAAFGRPIIGGRRPSAAAPPSMDFVNDLFVDAHVRVEPGNTSHMCGKLLIDLNP